MIQRRWIAQIVIFCLAASLSACNDIPKPQGKIGVVHVKDVPSAYINEFDMREDFDNDLHVLPGHLGNHRGLTGISDLDKYVCLSATSYANTLAAYAKLKTRYEQCEAGR